MGKSKLQKIFSTTAILGAFIVVGVLILMAMGVINSNRALIDFLLIIGILCFGCISCLIVARYLNDKSKRIPVLIVLILTGLTCLLWIIFVFIGQSFIDAIGNNTLTDAGFSGILTYTKITIILTIQTSFANLLVSNLFRLKRDMMVFQGIMYASNAIMDFWLTFVVLGIKVEGGHSFEWLFSTFFVTVFIISAVYTIMSNAILRRYERRRVQEDVVYGKETYSDSYKKAKAEQRANDPNSEHINSIEERIKKLDVLKEKGLITDEEYSARKSKILEEI